MVDWNGKENEFPALEVLYGGNNLADCSRWMIVLYPSIVSVRYYSMDQWLKNAGNVGHDILQISLLAVFLQMLNLMAYRPREKGMGQIIHRSS
ncbi:hypothetical protein lerEdw1_001468 [Lerista edwardsae]|nr:hypothetical protein lerEdw1_001468 [Lerista edwardsae]